MSKNRLIEKYIHFLSEKMSFKGPLMSFFSHKNIIFHVESWKIEDWFIHFDCLSGSTNYSLPNIENSEKSRKNFWLKNIFWQYAKITNFPWSIYSLAEPYVYPTSKINSHEKNALLNFRNYLPKSSASNVSS